MKMAYILFDKMTMLDFAGFYEAVTWMGILKAKEQVSWDFCSNKEQITDDRGLTVKINHVYPDLSGYDLIFIPGGFSTRQLGTIPILFHGFRLREMLSTRYLFVREL